MRIYEFHDNWTGGFTKTDFDCEIYIVAESRAAACDIFYDVFEVNPRSIYCDCCGVDFEIDEISQRRYEEVSDEHVLIDSDGNIVHFSKN